MRLVKEYKKIENIPRIGYTSSKEFKTYKKDDADVWSWYPIKKPENMNRKRYLEWKSNPEVKLWNREVNKGLRELESLLKGRVRVSSQSFRRESQK